jgi:hypothetical protein
MTTQPPQSPQIAYIECDVPEGLTLAEWRASRHARSTQGTSQRPAQTRPLLRGGRRVHVLYDLGRARPR